jgi:hypothetical protein
MPAPGGRWQARQEEAGVVEELIALAEREYQQRLAALHATRADLAEVDAALRRLAIDRVRLGDAADQRARDLQHQRQLLVEQATLQRADAQVQRELVQRLHGATDSEPTELPPEDPDGPRTEFVQPPFGAEQ